MTQNVLIEAKNINKSFIGVKALSDVDVVIREGEIHCLAGENGCGKSTLVKCIAGVYKPDSGTVVINGKTYNELTPFEAMNEGIQVIYQDLSLFSSMSVAENIAIGKLQFEKRKSVDWNEVYKIAQTQLDRIGVTMDLDESVGEISMANKQMVAICRALAQDAKVLIMDEPTTALTKTEVDQLLKIMIELKKKGLAIVFISHKLDEVFEVSDVITIFRNGYKIGDFLSSELNEKTLSYHMTGREVSYSMYKKEVVDKTPILKTEHLTRHGQYDDISIEIMPGDIVGLTGLLGSGRTEFALSLFGLNSADSGNIYVDGKKVTIKTPLDAKKYGIALLPEDRFTQGLFMERSNKENITSASIEDITSNGKIDHEAENLKAKDYIERLHVRTPSIETVVGTLSGGNQQKVVISKWLATNPKVFIMDTPTVGIDVGSKAEIYDEIQSFAKKGMAILLLSDELQEVMANCNKVVVMAHGAIVKKFNERELSTQGVEKEIAALISESKDEVKQNAEKEER